MKNDIDLHVALRAWEGAKALSVADGPPSLDYLRAEVRRHWYIAAQYHPPLASGKGNRACRRAFAVWACSVGVQGMLSYQFSPEAYHKEVTAKAWTLAHGAALLSTDLSRP